MHVRQKEWYSDDHHHCHGKEYLAIEPAPYKQTEHQQGNDQQKGSQNAKLF